MSSVDLGLGDPRADNRPLSDQEQALVQRLFGDPMSFPMSYKTWLVNWLEISDIALPMTAVVGLTNTLGVAAGESGSISLLSTGSLVLYAGTDTPSGTVAANGAAYDTTVQSGLFAVIGYSFGGSGSVFYVPTVPSPVAGCKYVIVT